MKKSLILAVLLVVFSLVGCSGSKESEINKMIGNWDAGNGFTYTIAKEKDNTYSYTIKDTQNGKSTKTNGGVYDKKTKTLVFSGNDGTKWTWKRLGE